MLTQNLPPSATEHARLQRLEQQAAVASVERQWRRMNRDFDASWTRVAPVVLGIVTTAQARMVRRADEYIPAVLEDTGQTRTLRPDALTNTDAFVGVAGNGMQTSAVIGTATIRAKQGVSRGLTEFQALQQAGNWLTQTVGTILSDTERAVEATGIGTRGVTGWVRMLTPPSCGRCVVLAGKWYARNQGFERHPRCDCRHIPASEAVGEDLRISVPDYLASLDKAGQVKVLGSEANWRAWDEFGADPNQIINAYRSKMSTAQDLRGNTVRYTAAGSSRRGFGGGRMSRASRMDLDAGAVVAPGRTNPALVRRMPETILRTTEGREQTLRQLRLYGWVI